MKPRNENDIICIPFIAHLISKKNCPKCILDSRFLKVRIIGLEPTRLSAPDPKSGMSTNFTISAKLCVQM